MPNKNIFIYNHLTGTEITREMTNEEQAAFDETTKNNLAIAKEEKQKQELLKENKISAYTKLGLTQAEIEALMPAPLTIVPSTT